jgi:hypothetical protein
MVKKGKFTLLNLDEFRDYLANNSFSRVINLIQNHHTFIPEYSHFNGQNHFSLLIAMENAHLERGFSEIAQNVTIFPDGMIALCRSFDRVPAGIMGANLHGLCIENVGDFDAGHDQMNAIQKQTIVSVNALLCLKFNLIPSLETIVYHHWFDLDTGQRTNGAGNTKSCPGTSFFGGNSPEAAQIGLIPSIVTSMQSLDFSHSPVGINEILKHGIVNVQTILNVRQGPGSTFKKIKSLTHGTPIAIFEAKEGWYRIDSGDQWVYSKFISLIE